MATAGQKLAIGMGAVAMGAAGLLAMSQGQGVGGADASVDSGPTFDSGALHVQFYDCVGAACLAGMTRLSNLLDVQMGYGYWSDAGALVSTPKPSYANGNILYQPDGAYLYPTTHYVLPVAHPVLVGRYELPTPDSVEPIVQALVASDPVLIDAGVGSLTLGALSSVWSTVTLPDGGTVLSDGAVLAPDGAVGSGSVAVGLDGGGPG